MTSAMATAESRSTAGIEERVGEDGVFEGDHVLAVDDFKVVEGALLAVEELHHAHPGDVLLGEAVDAGDGGADAADSCRGRGRGRGA